MNLRRKGIRRAFGAWLSVLMLVLSVAVPSLERLDATHTVHLEAEHDASTCQPGHDHTICTQVGANLPIPSEPGLAVARSETLHRSARSGLAFFDRSTLSDGHPTRAPPRS